jgi:hypothetical protein
MRDLLLFKHTAREAGVRDRQKGVQFRLKSELPLGTPRCDDAAGPDIEADAGRFCRALFHLG